MADEKRDKPVDESPIADVFDSRHPSASEKEWAQKTLAPALEKGPERPIGAPTGVNTDLLENGEHGPRVPSADLPALELCLDRVG